MKDKKSIYLDLHKLSKEDILKVYDYLKYKGEPISCAYAGNRFLSFGNGHLYGWNDYREIYSKIEVTLDKFYALFRNRIEFAYFANMDMFNEWYDENKIEIISLTFDFEWDRHLIYFKEKASL